MLKNVLLLSALVGLGNLALACAANTGAEEPSGSSAAAETASPSASGAAKVEVPEITRRCPPGEAWGCYDLGPTGKPLCECQPIDTAATPEITHRCPSGEVYGCYDLLPDGKPLCACQPPIDAVKAPEILHRCPSGETWGCYDLGPTGKPICACQ